MNQTTLILSLCVGGPIAAAVLPGAAPEGRARVRRPRSAKQGRGEVRGRGGERRSQREAKKRPSKEARERRRGEVHRSIIEAKAGPGSANGGP